MKLPHSLLPALGLSLVLVLSGCDKKIDVTEKPSTATSTLESKGLGMAIDNYIKEPTSVHAAEVEKAFAELDGEIAELKKQVSESTGDERAEALEKQKNLESYRSREMMRYTEAQAQATTESLKHEAQEVGEELQEAGKEVGEGLKEAADAVKDGVENAVDAVKDKLP